MASPGRPPTLADVQAAGFPVGGEPLALDLADTLIVATDPPIDLLADAARVRQFWALQQARLPPGARPPGLAATRALRAAIRDLLDARLAGRRLPPPAVARVNAAAAATPGSPHLVLSNDGAVAVAWRWQARDARALALAAAARSAIEVLASPAARLRRCANPACSMLFVADSARRQWCTPNICGNRARVARHYARTRSRAVSRSSDSRGPAR